MIDRQLDGKKKRYLDVEGVCNLSPTWLPHGQLLATVEGTASLPQS